MRLWVSPVPRKLRFYDLRHSHATLLRKAGVDLGAVQRALGHSSPEITAAVYDHSDLEDYRADVERALSFARTRQANAPVMQNGGTEEREGREPIGNPMELAAFRWSGRLDLNQRPLAPQVLSRSVQRVVELRKPSERLAAATRSGPAPRRSSPEFARNLLLACCWHSGAPTAC
jgi:hypothetical protein